MRRVRTMVISADELLREGLSRILNGPEFYVIHLAKRSSCATIPADASAQLIIFDLDEVSNESFDQLSALRTACPDAKIVVTTGSSSPDLFNKAFKTGVDGYLVRDMSADVFKRCLQLVVMGSQIFLSSVRLPSAPGESSTVVAAIDDANTRGALSPREGQILQCLVDGLSNKEIARRLSLAEATVKVYVKGLLRKIQAGNRTQAAVWALAGCGKKLAGSGERRSRRSETG